MLICFSVSIFHSNVKIYLYFVLYTLSTCAQINEHNYFLKIKWKKKHHYHIFVPYLLNLFSEFIIPDNSWIYLLYGLRVNCTTLTKWTNGFTFYSCINEFHYTNQLVFGYFRYLTKKYSCKILNVTKWT